MNDRLLRAAGELAAELRALEARQQGLLDRRVTVELALGLIRQIVPTAGAVGAEIVAAGAADREDVDSPDAVAAEPAASAATATVGAVAGGEVAAAASTPAGDSHPYDAAAAPPTPPRSRKPRVDRTDDAELGRICRDAHTAGRSMKETVMGFYKISATAAQQRITVARNRGADIPRVGGGRPAAASTAPTPDAEPDVDLDRVAAVASTVTSSSQAQERAVSIEFGVTAGMALVLISKARRAGLQIPIPGRAFEPKPAPARPTPVAGDAPWTSEPISRVPFSEDAARDAAAGPPAPVPATGTAWGAPTRNRQPVRPAPVKAGWSKADVVAAEAAVAAGSKGERG